MQDQPFPVGERTARFRAAHFAGASDADWNDWKWQMRNRIRDLDGIGRILRLTPGEEEAIRVANDTEYGLSAAVFGKDITRAMAVASRIESGICHINGPTVHDEAQMPFGGVKASGYGRFGGKAGIAEFTELRWITVQTTPRHYPF